MTRSTTLSRPLLLAALTAGALAGAHAVVPGQPSAAPGDPAAVPLLVTPAWLAAHLGDPGLVLLHVGEADAYRAKHIPGARLVELSDIALGNDHESLPHLELPPADDLRHRLEALGISSASRVVVYFGQDWVSPATRVVLTLDAAGLGGHAGLLDGGMPAWQRAGREVTAAVPPPRTGALAALAIRPIIVDATTVLASLGKPGFAVVDARNAEFYAGSKTGGGPQHPHRTGHIAGALSIPFDSLFDDRDTLRPLDDLAARFARAGVKPGDTVIGYCHIGQQATAMLFAARRLGHPVRLYDGSFEDWSVFHPGYPVEGPAADKAPAKAPPRAPDKAPTRPVTRP